MWVLYNERTNCVRACVQALVNKSLILAVLKAAERAVLTARLTGIAMLQLQSPCIEYGKVEAKELEKLPCLMAEALKRYHSRIISLMRKYLFYVPYLARDNYSDNGNWYGKLI